MGVRVVEIRNILDGFIIEKCIYAKNALYMIFNVKQMCRFPCIGLKIWMVMTNILTGIIFGIIMNERR